MRSGHRDATIVSRLLHFNLSGRNCLARRFQDQCQDNKQKKKKERKKERKEGNNKTGWLLELLHTVAFNRLTYLGHVDSVDEADRRETSRVKGVFW